MTTFISADHPFAEAVRAVAIQSVRQLLEATPSLVTARVRGSVHFDGRIWDDAWIPVAADDCRSISAIGFAAFHGHCELAATLLEFGARCDDMAIIDLGDKRSAVELAAWEGDLDTLRVLLKAHVDANSELPLEASLYTALSHRAADKAELLLEHGAKLDITTAAMRGDIDTVRRLLNVDPTVLDCLDQRSGRTPLEEAVNLGHLDVAKVFVEHGANVPYHVAAALGQLDEIDELLDQDPAAVNHLFSNKPLLTWALFGSQIATMKLLLERGADANGGDRWGVVPLRHASQLTSERTASAIDLLVAFGGDVNRKSKGFTPLEAARKADNEAVVSALLRHGAKDSNSI